MAPKNTPLQPPPIFNDTAESVPVDIQALIASRRAFLDGIAATVSPETATFDNVLGAIALKEADDSLQSGRLIMYNKVSVDAELRAAANNAKKDITDLYVECLMRDDIFPLVDALYQKRDTLNLDTESLRLLEERHLDYILNGLGLTDTEKRARLAAIKKRISTLSTQFSKNLNEETGAIWFTKEELDGVPDDIVQNLEKGTDENDGKLRHTFKQPIVLPTLKYAHNAETRKKLVFANENKCNENLVLFKEIIVLRHEMARLLGYEHYSALAVVENMAKTTATVTTFLEDLKTGLTPLAQIELARLKALKAQDRAARGLPAEDAYYRWDHTYYSRLQREINYQLDELLVSEYFALKPTIHAMLGIFETVMGFSFHRLEDAQTWHPDVIAYSVWNDEAGGGDFVGYLYMDLHPRPGKYGHACNSNFQASFLREDGSRHFPSTALICNFTPPTPEKPSLLKHREMRTLFHELGHGIHSLAGRTRYRAFHGTAVSRDFVEAPSQMLENWCWTPSVLKKISRHWKTDEPIPDDLVEKLVATEKVNQALSELVQVHFSMYDAACHTPKSQEEIEALDPSRMFNETRDVITLLDGFDDPNATHRCATFGHPVAGYAATYYGYLYSRVFSIDMFRSVFEKDPMDGAEGRRYRKTVLEMGGSRPELDSLKEFLGREPSSTAFYEYLGVAK